MSLNDGWKVAHSFLFNIFNIHRNLYHSNQLNVHKIKMTYAETETYMHVNCLRFLFFCSYAKGPYHIRNTPPFLIIKTFTQVSSESILSPESFNNQSLISSLETLCNLSLYKFHFPPAVLCQIAITFLLCFHFEK